MQGVPIQPPGCKSGQSMLLTSAILRRSFQPVPGGGLLSLSAMRPCEAGRPLEFGCVSALPPSARREADQRRLRPQHGGKAQGGGESHQENGQRRRLASFTWSCGGKVTYALHGTAAKSITCRVKRLAHPLRHSCNIGSVAYCSRF